MCGRIICMAFIGTIATLYAMESSKEIWCTDQVYHFGKYEDYQDFNLYNDPVDGGGFVQTLHGRYSPHKTEKLTLFRGRKPIMYLDKVAMGQTEYLSIDNKYRVIVAISNLSGYEVISQYRVACIPENYAHRKNICTVLAAWVHSWCPRKSQS